MKSITFETLSSLRRLIPTFLFQERNNRRLGNPYPLFIPQRRMPAAAELPTALPWTLQPHPTAALHADGAPIMSFTRGGAFAGGQQIPPLERLWLFLLGGRGKLGRGWLQHHPHACILYGNAVGRPFNLAVVVLDNRRSIARCDVIGVCGPHR
jgi:hypothetical protein